MVFAVDMAHLVGVKVAAHIDQVAFGLTGGHVPDRMIGPAGAVAVGGVGQGIAHLLERLGHRIAELGIEGGPLGDLPAILEHALARPDFHAPDLALAALRWVKRRQPLAGKGRVPDIPPDRLVGVDHLAALVIDRDLAARHLAHGDAGEATRFAIAADILVGRQEVGPVGVAVDHEVDRKSVV